MKFRTRMAPDHDSHVAHMDSARQGLASLISVTLVMSVGISIGVAAMLLAAGMWLERF
jgi:hypothetical protein